jgi:hypothetical protein
MVRKTFSEFFNLFIIFILFQNKHKEISIVIIFLLIVIISDKFFHTKRDRIKKKKNYFFGFYNISEHMQTMEAK